MNRMKIKSKFIAFALGSTLIPATLVAQPPQDFPGAYALTIKVIGLPFSISAFSICEPSGELKQNDYVPSRFGGMQSELGKGRWSKTANGGIVISYNTELPNGQVRHVNGIATLSGTKLTGTATVKLMNHDGSVVDSHEATVEGEKIQSRLAAQP
jgi:hypothetical protein